MKILIIGGLGYIGGRLAQYLHSHYPQYQIILTSTRSSRPDWAKDFLVRFLDISVKAQVQKLFVEIQCDIVIHCAGVPQQVCENDPNLAQQVNVDGTRHIVHYAKKVAVKKLVYFSTFQVYGLADQLQGMIKEDTPCHPQNVYGKSKRQAEEVILLEKDFPGQRIILRLSNAFGAPADINVAPTVWGLVYNAFCVAALKNGVIRPLNNPYRNFIPMGDVETAVDFLMHRNLPERSYVLNLGGVCNRCMGEVAHQVADVFERKRQQSIKVIEPDGKQATSFVYSIDVLQALGYSLSKDKASEEISKIITMAERYILEGN